MWPTANSTTLMTEEQTASESDMLAGIYRRQAGDRDRPMGSGQSPIAPTARTAALKLVQMVRTLCLPGSGWPADLPQTPQNLLPYVSEEVEELLEALHQPADDADAAIGLLQTTADSSLQTIGDRSFAQLVPDILWGVAASTYEAMCLLEGVSVSSHTAAGPAIEGVRLVPYLQFESRDQTLTLDLVTQSAFDEQTALPAATWIALEDGPWNGSGGSVADYVDHLWAAIAPEHAALQSLRNGWRIAALWPRQRWCHGVLQLKLALVPLPTAPRSETAAQTSTAPEAATLPANLALFAAEFPVGAAAAPKQLAAATQPPSLTSWVSFIDDRWVDQFVAAALSQHLIAQLTPQGAADIADVTTPRLVQWAYEAFERAEAQAYTALTFVQQSVLLSDLWPQLRWWLMRLHPGIMTLMGGVPVAYLAPQQDWRLGDLTLHVTLCLQLSEDTWWLNLSTGRWETAPSPLPEESVLIFRDPGLWTGQTWLLGELRSRLQMALKRQFPVMDLLLPGTPVELRSLEAADDACQGHLSLQLDLMLQA